MPSEAADRWQKVGKAYLILDQELDTLNGSGGGFLKLVRLAQITGLFLLELTETAAETPPIKKSEAC